MAGPVPGPLPPRERDPDILSASQVAEGLGFLGARAVTDLAAAGELPGTKVGGTWLFTWPAIRTWRTLRWPAIYERIAGPGVPDGPVLTAAELAGRLGFRDPQTVTDLAAAGELAGVKLGRDWLFSWAAIYQRIAGPGAPDGPVFSAAQLGRWLGASAPAVRRAAAPPGTARGLPGCKIGKQWLFALEAVRLQLAGPPEVPDTPGGGAADMAAGAAGRTPLR